jgi:hypothetical protein
LHSKTNFQLNLVNILNQHDPDLKSSKSHRKKKSWMRVTRSNLEPIKEQNITLYLPAVVTEYRLLEVRMRSEQDIQRQTQDMVETLTATVVIHFSTLVWAFGRHERSLGQRSSKS